MIRLALWIQIFGILFICLFIALIMLSWIGALTPESLYPQ